MENYSFFARISNCYGSLSSKFFESLCLMSSRSELSIQQALAAPSLFQRIRRFFDDRRARHRAIRELRNLRDHDLRDIGLERQDIAAIVDREVGRFRLDEFRSRG
jgi:uncharacterized protein YjiS (DUF1127 family)